MLSNLNYLLVTTTCLVAICTAIRVDWNTNTGPIIPPTPRTTIRPVPPYREPAPVWEDLSNDIPNPNPYVYVLPPPSRPKQGLNTNVNYNINAKNNYGTLINPHNAATYYQQNNNSPQVASLSAQYIPNVGTRYVAVVPKSSTTTKFPISSPNSLSSNDNNSYKWQGKYNAKTKKYKAYEKVKYVPLNYYSLFKKSDSASEATSLKKKLNAAETKPFWFKGNRQNLPYKDSLVKFNTQNKWPSTTSRPTTRTNMSSTTLKDSLVKFNTQNKWPSTTRTTTTTTNMPSSTLKDSLVKFNTQNKWPSTTRTTTNMPSTTLKDSLVKFNTQNKWPFTTSTTTTTTNMPSTTLKDALVVSTKSYSKNVHDKDSYKLKDKFTKTVDKAKKS